MNPLFWLDLRVRVRERRLWVIALFFLLLPLIIATLAMSLALSESGDLAPSDIGTVLSMCLIFCHAGLIVMLSPLAAAQRISQEREQRTYAALVNSPLTPQVIAAGKQQGAWAFTLWLGGLTLPFVVVSLFWGGMSPFTVLACYALNLLAGMTLTSLALGLSGLFGRSMSAYLASGALVFLWGYAMPMIGGLLMALTESTRTIFCCFMLHHPCAPQIWMCMRGVGEGATYGSYGGWVPVYGVAVWGLLAWLGHRLAVHGLRREVY